MEAIANQAHPAYNLTWEYTPSMFGRGPRHRAHHGFWVIEELKNKRFKLKHKSIYLEHESEHATLEEAKRVALVEDFKLVTKNYLIRKKPGLYATLDGRIVAKYMTSPELRSALPPGHNTVRPGYAIYVDGKFWSCSFDLRSAQHDVSSRRCPV